MLKEVPLHMYVWCHQRLLPNPSK